MKKRKRLCGAPAVLGVLGVLVMAGVTPAQASTDATGLRPNPQPGRNAYPPDALPLGPSDLTETRTTTTLQPGVTLTRIVRGESDPALGWTVEVSIPGGESSPDPDAPPTALKDRASADELAGRLQQDGFSPRVEQVTTPKAADFAGGTLGWR
ncbi:sporulation domain-containing protein, partial [Streptomyces spiralis]